MKKLAVVLFTIIAAAGCSSTKNAPLAKNADLVSFEYEAITRGAYKKVTVDQDSIMTIKDRDMKEVITRQLSKADWESLVEALDKVNLETIENLVPPSTKSHADAALAANLKVIKKDRTYSSNSFDHGNPPAEIKELVDRIIQMSDLPKTKK
jgi:hypothetical protein